MGFEGCVSILVPLLVKLLSSLGFWGRVMFLSPWPVRLTVIGNGWYWSIGTRWYRASVELEIIPWVRTLVNSFFLEIDIQGIDVIAHPSHFGGPTGLIENRIDSGYVLDAKHPIRRSIYFDIMPKEDIDIPVLTGFLVLEAGRRTGKRAMRKCVSLEKIG